MSLAVSTRWDRIEIPDQVLSSAKFFILWTPPRLGVRVTAVTGSHPDPDHLGGVCLDGVCMGNDGDGVTYAGTSSTGATFLSGLVADGLADVAFHAYVAVAHLTP